ncbi:YajG family lipoprotein [Neobacillus vireti]|uniref:hypothetical protein n=1 Tax=Neobacillus vireti TaxID=220686 RepID=UPI00041E3E6A|nr:hypothetical protein [Neobacillus vireti]KLT18103.1 hypothetical protein AA980_10550 [Neobacillus vireti]
MGRWNKWMGALILLFMLTSCSHSSQKVGKGDFNPNMSATEKAVAEQAVSYELIGHTSIV